MTAQQPIPLDPETDRREALDLVRRAVKAAADDPEVITTVMLINIVLVQDSR